MERVIYIDSVFGINLIMDLLLLKLTAETLKKKTTLRRILAGALLGAAGYCFLLCIPQISYPVKVLMGMIPLGMGMIKLVLRTKGLKELLYGTGLLFTYSFFLGGFLLFLQKRIPFLSRHKDSVLLLLLAGGSGAAVLYRGIKRNREKQKKHFCQVTLPGDEGLLSVAGLVDTGNGLIEPVSKRPVAVLEEAVWEKMSRWKRPEKYRLIPFHSIGKEHGMLDGYEVENIRLWEETENRCLSSGLIAVFKGKLSARGEYQMLLPFEWQELESKREEEREIKIAGRRIGK